MTLVRRRALLIAAVLRNLRKSLSATFADGRLEFPLHAAEAVGDRGYWIRGDGRLALVRSEHEDRGDALCDGDREGWTLDDVGFVFGKSRERIRQVEARALRKLRHPSRATLLWSAWKGVER